MVILGGNMRYTLYSTIMELKHATNTDSKIKEVTLYSTIMELKLQSLLTMLPSSAALYSTIMELKLLLRI